jgi:hypothetical protein
MIKPEFWSSEQIVECSMTARLLFIGLWNFADDAGNQPFAVKRIKMEIFPADDFNESQMGGFILELLNGELLELYYHNEKPYLHITGWHHQKIDKPTYKFPPHPGGMNSTTARRGVDDGSLLNETKRNESKRNETKSNEVKVNQENVRTYDRTVDRSCLDGVDWEAVYDRCKLLAEKIHEAWDSTVEKWVHSANEQIPVTTPWDMPADFREKLIKANAIVEAGILPSEWIRDVIVMMLEGPKKKKASGWLGKVLASTAREKYGVDFDDFKRQITIQEVT